MKGHLKERAPGVWTLAADAPARPGGRRRQVFRTAHGSRRTAQAALNRLLAEVQSGEFREPSKLTVAEFLTRWLATARTHLAATSIAAYESYVRCHIGPRLGAIPLARLTPLHVQEYYAQALAAGLSPRSVAQHGKVLHAALEQAIGWDLLESNPAAGRRARRPRWEGRTPRPLLPHEVRQVLEASAGTDLYLAILLATAAGLRRGEVMALRWPDIDLSRGRLTISGTLTIAREVLPPKTKGSRRCVTLPPIAVNALARHRAAQAEIRLAVGPAYQDRGFLFASTTGSPLPLNWPTRAFPALCESLGLPRCHFHDLRHTAATLLLLEGVHPKIVSERLGHAAIGITMDLYSTVLPTMQEEAARKTEDALRRALEG